MISLQWVNGQKTKASFKAKFNFRKPSYPREFCWHKSAQKLQWEKFFTSVVASKGNSLGVSEKSLGLWRGYAIYTHTCLLSLWGEEQYFCISISKCLLYNEKCIKGKLLGILFFNPLTLKKIWETETSNRVALIIHRILLCERPLTSLHAGT